MLAIQTCISRCCSNWLTCHLEVTRCAPGVTPYSLLLVIWFLWGCSLAWMPHHVGEVQLHCLLQGRTLGLCAALILGCGRLLRRLQCAADCMCWSIWCAACTSNRDNSDFVRALCCAVGTGWYQPPWSLPGKPTLVLCQRHCCMPVDGCATQQQLLCFGAAPSRVLVLRALTAAAAVARCLLFVCCLLLNAAAQRIQHAGSLTRRRCSALLHSAC